MRRLRACAGASQCRERGRSADASRSQRSPGPSHSQHRCGGRAVRRGHRRRRPGTDRLDQQRRTALLHHVPRSRTWRACAHAPAVGRWIPVRAGADRSCRCNAREGARGARRSLEWIRGDAGGCVADAAGDLLLRGRHVHRLHAADPCAARRRADGSDGAAEGGNESGAAPRGQRLAGCAGGTIP